MYSCVSFGLLFLFFFFFFLHGGLERCIRGISTQKKCWVKSKAFLYLSIFSQFLNLNGCFIAVSKSVFLLSRLVIC